jgi:hypothetical protein
MHRSYESGQLDAAIEDAIDDFDALRVAHVLEQIDDDDETDIDRRASLDYLGEELHRMSETLLGTVSQLVAPDWAAARAIIDNAANNAQVVEALQVSLARVYATQSSEMAARCLEITRNVLPALPGDLSLSYLRRLTRCYIAGFYPEAIILAGSVVEQELKATFSRKGVPMPATATGESTMKSRLSAAARFGWLTKRGVQAAETIWLRRNKVTHEDPTLVRQSAETIGLTVSVLGELVQVR